MDFSIPKDIFIAAVIFAVLPIFFPFLLPVVIIGVLLVFAVILFGEKTFIFIGIISFLTLTSTISIQLRTIVQIFNVIIFIYLFFKKYGLDLRKYPKLPKEIKIVLVFVCLSMLTATIFSKFIFLGVEQIIRLSIFLSIVYSIYALTENIHDVKLLVFSLLLVGIIYSTTLFIELAKNDFNFIQLNLKQLDKVNNDYLNMNTIGSLLIITISISLSAFFGTNTKKYKILYGFLLFIYFVGLLITNSRAAILCVAVSSLIILYKLRKHFIKKIIYTFFFIIPLFFLKPVYNFFDIYFRLERLSTGRDVILSTIFNVIKDNWILGTGPAATKYSLYPHLPFMLGSPAEKFMAFHYGEIEFGHAHNFYLFFWSDLGLLGLFTSILLPVMFFKMCIRLLHKWKEVDLQNYYLLLGILAAGVGLFIRGFFEWGNLISYGTLSIDLPFWILLIILSFFYFDKSGGKIEKTQESLSS